MRICLGAQALGYSCETAKTVNDIRTRAAGRLKMQDLDNAGPGK